MSRSIGSAVGRLLAAVFDTDAAAEAATAALVSSGVAADRIERYAGSEDVAAFDASGRRRGWRGRLFRILRR